MDVDVPLPTLVVGRHLLTIEASSTRTGPDGRPLSDRLARTVTVVTSRLTIDRHRLAGADDAAVDSRAAPT